MRVLRLVLSALFICGFIGAANAEAEAENYDPNYIPWKPQPQRFNDCGVQMALDPRWSFAKSTETLDSGKVRTTYQFNLWDYWKQRDDRPFSKYMITPGLLMSINCFKAGESAASDFKAYVKDRRKSHIEREETKSLGASFKPMRRKGGTGADQAFYYTYYTRTEDRAVNDGLAYYALHRGNVVRIFFTMDRKQGSPYVSDLPAGQKITVADLTVRLSGRVTKNVLAVNRYAYARTERENYEIIDAIIQSFKAY